MLCAFTPLFLDYRILWDIVCSPSLSVGTLCLTWENNFAVANAEFFFYPSLHLEAPKRQNYTPKALALNALPHLPSLLTSIRHLPGNDFSFHFIEIGFVIPFSRTCKHNTNTVDFPSLLHEGRQKLQQSKKV